MQVIGTAKKFESVSGAFSTTPSRLRKLRVLVAYDGSQNAQTALEDLKRAGLPEDLNAFVAVTDVWLPSSPYEISRAVAARRLTALTAGVACYAPALREREEERALSRDAERRLRFLFPRATVKSESLSDALPPARELLRKAEDWGADLIVIGSPRSPSPHITDYCGAAVKLAAQARCSARIARPSGSRHSAPARIMICVDGSAYAKQVSQAILTVTERVWPEGSEAHVVTVNKYAPPIRLANRTAGSEPVSRDADGVENTTTLVNGVALDQLKESGLKVSTAIKEGEPQNELIQEAIDWGADCIFVDADGFNHQKGSVFDRISLAKVVESLALGAHCSVEVVRTKNVSDSHLKPAA